MSKLSQKQINMIKKTGKVSIFKEIFKCQTAKYLFPNRISQIKYEIKNLWFIWNDMKEDRKDIKREIENLQNQKKKIDKDIKSKRKTYKKMYDIRHNLFQRILELRREKNEIIKEEDGKTNKLQNI